MSGKENELSDAVKGAARAYPGITTLYFYISQEFSPSSKKDIVKPAYQTNIENVFACGDCRTGQSLVVKAMVDGQKCAEAVEKYLAK